MPHGIHELRLRGCGFLGQPQTFRHHEWDRGRWHHRAAEAQEQEQIDFFDPENSPIFMTEVGYDVGGTIIL